MSDYNNNQDFELSWDSEIEGNIKEYILLPEGEYDFVVKKFERGRFNGSDKMKACPKATLTLSINTPQGEAIAQKDLYLLKSKEDYISEFFICIGQGKKDERIKPNWSAITGARGRCKIGTPRIYNGNQYNNVVRFLEPAAPQPQQYQQPQQYAGAPQNTTTAPQQPPAGGGWQGGKF